MHLPVYSHIIFNFGGIFPLEVSTCFSLKCGIPHSLPWTIHIIIIVGFTISQIIILILSLLCLFDHISFLQILFLYWQRRLEYWECLSLVTGRKWRGMWPGKSVLDSSSCGNVCLLCLQKYIGCQGALLLHSPVSFHWSRHASQYCTWSTPAVALGSSSLLSSQDLISL